MHCYFNRIHANYLYVSVSTKVYATQCNICSSILFQAKWYVWLSQLTAWCRKKNQSINNSPIVCEIMMIIIETRQMCFFHEVILMTFHSTLWSARKKKFGQCLPYAYFSNKNIRQGLKSQIANQKLILFWDYMHFI